MVTVTTNDNDWNGLKIYSWRASLRIASETEFGKKSTPIREFRKKPRIIAIVYKFGIFFRVIHLHSITYI